MARGAGRGSTPISAGRWPRPFWATRRRHDVRRATLGGNATLIGASANVVTAGICARNDRPVTFVAWLRYGLPLTICQLAVSALYVLALFRVTR